MFERPLVPAALALLIGAAAHGSQAASFNRIASFPSPRTCRPKEVPADHKTSAKIITVSRDGKTLIYSDSPLGGIGRVDIRDPDAPKAAGLVDLRGEPTSMATAGKPAENLDLEGIAADGKGGFWLSSEGRTDKKIPHAIYYIDASGRIDQTLPFPDELLKQETRFGAEGITLSKNTLWIAIQSQWQDDPADTVKLVTDNLTTKQWRAVRYPIEPAVTVWGRLSEISAYGNAVYVIERDNQIGKQARIKRLYKVALDELTPAPPGGELPLVHKQQVHDFIPDLKTLSGYVLDKLEGFTVDASGRSPCLTEEAVAAVGRRVGSPLLCKLM